MKSIQPPLGPGLAEAVAEAVAVGFGAEGCMAWYSEGVRLCPQPGAAEKHTQRQQAKDKAAAAATTGVVAVPGAAAEHEPEPEQVVAVQLLDDLVGYNMLLLLNDAAMPAAGPGTEAWCKRVGDVLGISVVTPTQHSIAPAYSLLPLDNQAGVAEAIKAVGEQYLRPEEGDGEGYPSSGGGGAMAAVGVVVRPDRYVLGVASAVADVAMLLTSVAGTLGLARQWENAEMEGGPR